MRQPTAKEKFVLQNCLEGLKGDVQAVTEQEPNRDVHGTFRVNLEVMLRILERLEREQ